MATLANWNDDAARKNLAVIKDAAALGPCVKLLVRDPDERAEFDISADTPRRIRSSIPSRATWRHRKKLRSRCRRR